MIRTDKLTRKRILGACISLSILGFVGCFWSIRFLKWLPIADLTWRPATAAERATIASKFDEIYHSLLDVSKDELLYEKLSDFLVGPFNLRVNAPKCIQRGWDAVYGTNQSYSEIVIAYRRRWSEIGQLYSEANLGKDFEDVSGFAIYEIDNWSAGLRLLGLTESMFDKMQEQYKVIYGVKFFYAEPSDKCLPRQ